MRFLDLSATQIGHGGAAALKTILQAPHCQIHLLNLADNSLGAPEVDLLLEGLRGNVNLTSLNLSGNPLPPPTISRLLSKQAGVVLSRLQLSRIGSFGAVQCNELAELLRSDSMRLESLDISDNPIDESSASLLLQSLWKNKTIQSFRMRRVKIASSDMVTVAARFERAFPLVVLDIDATTSQGKIFASKVLSDLGT